jgi:hypothetical protein
VEAGFGDRYGADKEACGEEFRDCDESCRVWKEYWEEWREKFEEHERGEGEDPCGGDGFA